MRKIGKHAEYLEIAITKFVEKKIFYKLEIMLEQPWKTRNVYGIYEKKTLA